MKKKPEEGRRTGTQTKTPRRCRFITTHFAVPRTNVCYSKKFLAQTTKGMQSTSLLVDPLVDGPLVRDGTVLSAEPEGNLLLGRVHGVGAVADVASNINGKVTTDGAGGRGEGVGGAEEGSALLDDVLSLPDHGNDGAGGHVAETEITRRERAKEMGISISPPHSACSLRTSGHYTHLQRPG